MLAGAAGKSQPARLGGNGSSRLRKKSHRARWLSCLDEKGMRQKDSDAFRPMVAWLARVS
jgi:hypothetical protein